MKRILMLGLSVILLSGCSSIIGTRNAPDEMAVVDAPPLSLPPNFELRPPVKGQKKAEREQKATEDAAKRVLLGSDQRAVVDEGDTEGWLVKMAGGEKRDPEIRDRLMMEEHSEIEVENKRGWFRRTFGTMNEPQTELEGMPSEELGGSSLEIRTPQE